MEKLYLEASQYTPKIELDPAGVMTFIGKSYPENTFEFYYCVAEWFKTYFKQKLTNKTIINFEIIYFNSSSSKFFFDLFDLFEDNCNEFNIEVNWYYDEHNESALEAGEDFKEDFEKLSINLLKKDS